MEEHITRRDAIINIQTYLRKLGYTGVGGVPVPIDGIFESVTEEAVTAFQRSNGLLPSGIVDKTTWDLLYTLYSERIRDELEARGIFPFPDTPEDYAVTVGTRSSLVTVIQLLLDELETKYDGFADIAVDGVYSEDTARAVRLFQQINMLDPSGNVDKRTWNRLVREYSNLQY